MRPAFIDTADAAEQMRVAESTVRSWVHRGWLPVLGYTNAPHRKAWYRYEDVLKAERRARRGPELA